MPRPLSARSLIASTLLGTRPPVLPSRLLVAFTALFGVSEGATRVALTRMTDRGELVKEDGAYRLTGALLARQERQEAGLEPATRRWEGQWELYVVRPGSRPSRDRAALRHALVHLGLGERREGTWIRPFNLAPERLAPDRQVVDRQADRFIGGSDADPRVLVGELFDLDGWAARARVLATQMEDLTPRLRAADHHALAPGFEVAAAVLRHLVSDPVLPPEVHPPGWPAPTLRHEYRSYDHAYRAVLADFFRGQRR